MIKCVKNYALDANKGVNGMIGNGFSNKFERKFGRYAIPNLSLYLVICYAVGYLIYIINPSFLGYLTLDPFKIFMHGQIWRLITFVFVPERSGFILWFVMTTLLYYYIGNILERQWGTTRFTVFYGLGVLLNILVGLVIYGVNYGQLSGAGIPADQIQNYLSNFATVDMYYINMSLFFSFATLYPEMQVLLMGILPLKVKWLAWLDAAWFAYTIIRMLLNQQGIMILLPLVAILNYFTFFWDDLMGTIRRTGERAAYRTRPQTINFKKAQKQVREHKGYLHKCAVCGITDADDPNMEFRYCSKCNGYYCYCMKHINDHVHVQ